MNKEELQPLIGKYINGYKIVKVEDDPFIKGQVNLWTDEMEITAFGDRSSRKFVIQDEKSNATIFMENENKYKNVLEETNYIDKYNSFWKDIVENEDGILNKDQVMRELSDYSMVLDNCADAYYLLSNGKISKQNTKFFEVENIFNQEYIERRYYNELQQENKQLKDNWDKLKEYCQDNSFMQNTKDYGTLTVIDADELAIQMQELENGDNNVIQ